MNFPSTLLFSPDTACVLFDGVTFPNVGGSRESFSDSRWMGSSRECWTSRKQKLRSMMYFWIVVLFIFQTKTDNWSYWHFSAMPWEIKFPVREFENNVFFKFCLWFSSFHWSFRKAFSWKQLNRKCLALFVSCFESGFTRTHPDINSTKSLTKASSSFTRCSFLCSDYLNRKLCTQVFENANKHSTCSILN